jgi:hypothetical protein
MLGAADRDARRALGEAALAVERGADAPRLVDVGNDALVLGGVAAGILSRPGADGVPSWQVSGR